MHILFCIETQMVKIEKVRFPHRNEIKKNCSASSMNLGIIQILFNNTGNEMHL